MKKVAIALLVVLAIPALFGVGVGIRWAGIQAYRFLGIEMESARTDVYRENKSYVEGTVRDLRRLQREYETATDSQKETLRTIILQRSDELDYDRLPSDVRRFVESL